MVSSAANAVTAKALSMYGKRLTAKNYSELICCKNLPEIVVYLKTKTQYKNILQGFNEIKPKRVDLEKKINSKLIENLIILAKYDRAIGEKFFGYIIANLEITQLMKILMLVSFENEKVPEYNSPNFQKYSKINFKELSLAKDYKNILKTLRNTPYFKILSKFKPSKEGTTIDLNEIENELYSYLYNYLKSTIEKHISGAAKRDYLKFFNNFIDLKNMIWIARMKKFYDVSPEYMRNMLFKWGHLSKETLEKFLNEKDDKKMMEDMKTSPLGKKWFSKGLDIMDRIPLNMMWKKSKHNIRFSSSPQVVMMSYIYLLEIEISNIINIIEGVKYGLRSEEIEHMLLQ